MRKKIIMGNWKMNKTVDETEAHLNSLKEVLKGGKIDIVVCPPFTSLDRANKVLEGSSLLLGAQNMFYEPRGAYTGEVSAEMLKSLSVSYVILGHSDRRTKFQETDQIINKKVLQALEYQIIPVICVGDTLEERQSQTDKDKVEFQVRKALDNVALKDATKCIIAYEPLWAISTNEGITSTKEDAENMCYHIRYVVEKIYGQEVAENMRILYGGSVNSSNVNEYCSMENIDGVLVGGASLKLEFADMVSKLK